MRHSLAIAGLAFMLGACPIVHAQAQAPAAPPAAPAAPMPSPAPMRHRPPMRHHMEPVSTPPEAGAENCGTPDEPKACPPLPRNPLPTYPKNK